MSSRSARASLPQSELSAGFDRERARRSQAFCETIQNFVSALGPAVAGDGATIDGGLGQQRRRRHRQAWQGADGQIVGVRDLVSRAGLPDRMLGLWRRGRHATHPTTLASRGSIRAPGHHAGILESRMLYHKGGCHDELIVRYT